MRIKLTENMFVFSSSTDTVYFITVVRCRQRKKTIRESISNYFERKKKTITTNARGSQFSSLLVTEVEWNYLTKHMYILHVYVFPIHGNT